MKQIAKYYKDSEMKKSFYVEYDDESPCIICGEPVISASMGGTAICGWCDMGKCRYCKVTMFVLREEIDGCESKKRWLEHMKYHREKEPDFNNKALIAHRGMFAEILRKNREEYETSKNARPVV